MEPKIAKNQPSPQLAIRCAYSALWRVERLQPHPRNPNKHPEAQIALLARILTHQGIRRPVLVSNRSGFVVAGHGLLAACLKLGLREVPVDLQDFATEADEYAHLVADNRIAELAEISAPDLASILQELEAGGFDVTLAGFSADALANVLASLDGSAAQEAARLTLAQRFGVPPFTVLDARQGYWQLRKAAWLALGIKSELGRNENYVKSGTNKTAPGGALMPAMNYKKGQRGDGKGRAVQPRKT